MVDPDATIQPPQDETSAIDAVEQCLRQGEPLLAYNAVQEGLSGWPASLRLRQLKGLAIARSGDTQRANDFLRTLAAEGVADAETQGMLARTHKDLALRSPDAAGRALHLAAAFRIYHQAYVAARAAGAAADAWYTGINAAAIAVWQGDLSGARRIAGDVRELCVEAHRGAAAADYWLEATLGEAALILGDTAAAADHYARAAARAAGRYGNLASTRRQAQLLAEQLPANVAWIGEVLRIPPVVMYTGHMIDQSARAAPRLPPSLESAVGAAIRERLASIRPCAAYGSAACGADILCLEALHDIGAETHIVLPFPAAEFHRISVDFAPGDWSARFERVLAAADSVTVTSDYRAHGSTATFEYANLIVTGMARLRAQVLGTNLRGLAIWDGKPAVRGGGAASLVRIWRQQRVDLDEVRLGDLPAAPAAPESPVSPGSPGSPGSPVSHVPPPSPASIAAARPQPTPALDAEQLPAGFTHEIRAMLFADAAGYSGLSEDQTPHFITQFFGAVADLNAATVHRPEHVETTGDGLYMVFADVSDAGSYALQLSRLVAGTDWQARGLPGGLSMRIALHCGPVYCGRNPVTGAPLYTGPHTSRAARIEPITPPGQVYASSAFAAVAAAIGAQGLSLQYVGRMPLAKGYGLLGLYHVRRAG